MVLLLRTVRGAPKAKADYHFKKLQLCSAALFSFSHGSNDAQKTVGIILPLLFSIGYFGYPLEKVGEGINPVTNIL
ncbi:MAG: inorganic phosphate transporter, partial [Methanomicrobiales archaeon]